MRFSGKQLGISLVEVMVALVISVFLLGGVIQVYIGNKATFSFTDSLAEIQENGRFALDIVTQDLRSADVWGCIHFGSMAEKRKNIRDTLDTTTVPGYDANWHDFMDGAAITGTNNTGLNGSDTITLRGSKPGQANIESPFYNETNNKIVTSEVTTFGANDIVLIARCGTNEGKPRVGADIMRLTSVLPLNGNTQREFTVSGDKSQQYENDATMIELQTVTYSLAAAATGGAPTLIRTEFGQALELVEGVQDMQILYGIDTTNNDFANQYVTSNNVPDFDDVVSLRVMLLVRSSDDFVIDAAQTYTFNGQQVTPADTRIRQVFTSTIALRNRIGSGSGVAP